MHPIIFKSLRLSICVCVGVLGLNSCYLSKSPENRIAEKRALLEGEFHQELLYQQRGGGGTERLQLTWNQALDKMYMENPSLLKADFRVEDAVAQQKQVYTDLIPLVSVGVSGSFEVQDADEAFDDIRLRVYSYLPLGDIIRMPKKIYTKKMYYIGSQLQAEQTMRQEVIALYRLFQQQYLIELEGKALKLEGALAQSLVGVGGIEEIKAREAYRSAQEAWQDRREDWRVKVGDFFMRDYAKINLVRKSLPNITYNPSQLDFTDSGRWGMLALNLLAMEDIAKDARILDTYMRYLPQPNLGVSAPPLYSDSNSGSFDPNAIRFSPSANWSLDTRGTISKQLNRIKREEPITDWRADKRRREEIKKLLEGKRALAEVQKELATLRKAMNGYRTSVKAGLVKDPEGAIRTMRKLREKEVRLAAQEIEICTSFWLIDEQRWDKTTKRWQESRKVRAKLRKEARKNKKKG
jgi:hypothetical protein